LFRYYDKAIDDESTEGLPSSYRYWRATRYPSLGRLIYTVWIQEPDDAPIQWETVCETRVRADAGQLLSMTTYDPTVVTVGGRPRRRIGCAGLQ